MLSKFKYYFYFLLLFCYSSAICQTQTLEDLSSMLGFATTSGDGYSTTIGGQGGPRDTLTTLSALQAYAKNREKETAPAILYISGKITSTLTQTIVFKHGANLSIFGINNAELENIGLRIWDYHNTIIRNLTIHEVFYPDDGLSIEDSHHIWIDHCEFYSINETNTGTDTYDGLLDIKKGSKNVTVSWCKLHDHIKCMLIGHTDNSNQGAVDRQMSISIHHNYFYNTAGRNPSLRHGQVHLYNNYFQNITDYGMAVRQSAHALIENNHYEDVRIPIITNKFNGPDGFVCESGNTYSGAYDENANVITQIDCDFWNNLPYTYKLDLVDDMKNLVLQGAGTFDQTTSTTSLLESKTPFTIAPNPVGDYLNITLVSGKSGVAKVDILGMNGRFFSNHTFHLKDRSSMININTNHLPKGLYVLSISVGRDVSHQKFVRF